MNTVVKMVYCYDCKFFSRGEAEERGRVSEYFVCDATHRALWKRFLCYDLDCRFYEAAESASEICRDCISLCDDALEIIHELKEEDEVAAKKD